MFTHLNLSAKNYIYLITSSAVALCLSAQVVNAAPRFRNAIELENTKQGTRAWQHPDRIKLFEEKNFEAGPLIARATVPNAPAVAAATTCDASAPSFPWALDDCLTGYTSAPSVTKGGSLDFKIYSAAPTYTISFYRLGWYGGAGGTLVSTTADQTAISQPACTMQAETGLTECNWSNSYTLNVPSTWMTGVYLAQLTGSTGWKNEILFVVRDDSRPADFLYQVPVLTYLAYNNYPSGTGKSTYDINSAGSNTLVNAPRAVKVSLDRPQHHQFGSALSSEWSEIHLVAWLEKMGYNINYTTDLDVHTSRSDYLKAYKGLIVGGHSEYWTKSMYDKAEQARDAGVSLAFFGANANHWQVRMENSSTGVSNRVLVCYKDEGSSSYDPIKDVTQTKKWRDLGRAEQTLIGVQHDIGGWSLGLANQQLLKVQNTTHWAYNDSGLANGNDIPYLLGYEIDNLNPAYPKPPLLTPTSQTIIAQSQYYNRNNTLYQAQASLYQAPSGAWVFGSGTISWSWALAKQADSSRVFQNAGIQQVTKNILDAFRNVTTPTTTNRPPVAVNDSVTVNQGASISVSVLSNDSDPDGNNLTISSVGAAAHGVASKNGTSITYKPAANYTGADSFTYTISDGLGGTATGTVTVAVKSVTSVNRPPVAVNDSATVNQGASVSILVLGNDSDPDRNSLTISSVGAAAHGVASKNGTSITYKPAANYKGNDSFTYTIRDGFGGTAKATVTVTVKSVTSVNRPPVAVNDSATVNQGASVSILVLGNDSDPDRNSLTISSVGAAAHGVASKNGTSITYKPAANYKGTDSFTYTIRDGFGGTDKATVTVTVKSVASVNRPPVAVNDSATVNQGASVSLLVLGNDSDPDRNSLTISSVGAAAHGVASKNGTSITYKPAANYTGTDSFTYTIRDGFGGTAKATVTVTVKSVTSVNHAPTAVYDVATVTSLGTDKVITIYPLSNDSDVDGNP